MKSLGLLGILALSAPAFAGTAPPPASPPAASAPAGSGDVWKHLDYGQSYTLGHHRAAVPRPAEDAPAPVATKPHTLGDSQVGKVVHDRLADVQRCWLKLPDKQRIDSTAVLHLAIAPTGGVVDVTIGGDVPDGAVPCLTAAVERWQFPAAETSSEVSYPVMLRSL